MKFKPTFGVVKNLNIESAKFYLIFNALPEKQNIYCHEVPENF